MKKYKVKSPVKLFSGISWGIAFVGGESVAFDDKRLFDKLVAKGYKSVEIEDDEAKEKKAAEKAAAKATKEAEAKKLAEEELAKANK